MKIGEKYLCIEDVVMNTGETAYIKGKIYHSDNPGCLTDEQGDDCHTWDNIREMNKHFKEETTMHYKVTRQQMKEIYDIACSTWKPRIKALTKKYIGALDDEGELPEDEVRAMKAAATTDQRPVLDKIFPQDLNVFTREFDGMEMTEVNSKYFGGKSVMYVGNGMIPQGRKELQGRCIWIRDEYKVELIEEGSNTYLIITEKEQ